MPTQTHYQDGLLRIANITHHWLYRSTWSICEIFYTYPNNTYCDAHLMHLDAIVSTNHQINSKIITEQLPKSNRSTYFAIKVCVCVCEIGLAPFKLYYSIRFNHNLIEWIKFHIINMQRWPQRGSSTHHPLDNNLEIGWIAYRTHRKREREKKSNKQRLLHGK